MLKSKIWYNFLKMYIVFLWPWDVSRGFYKDILFYCCSENERIASMRLYSNSVHLRGKNTGPETQLTEPTLMYISWYPFKFSTVCCHYNSSSTTSLILIWKGRQCYIVLHTFYIYLRTLLFTRMPILKLKKNRKSLWRARTLTVSFSSEQIICTGERELKHRLDLHQCTFLYQQLFSPQLWYSEEHFQVF